MTKCPKCQKPLNQGAKFCGSCGNPIQATEEISPQDLFSVSSTNNAFSDADFDDFGPADEFMPQESKATAPLEEEKKMEPLPVNQPAAANPVPPMTTPAKPYTEPERKKFELEDDPTTAEETKPEPAAKSLDRKTLKKVQKSTTKKPQVTAVAPPGLLKAMCFSSLSFLAWVLPLGLFWIVFEKNGFSAGSALLLSPLLIPLFFWALLRKKGFYSDFVLRYSLALGVLTILFLHFSRPLQGSLNLDWQGFSLLLHYDFLLFLTLIFFAQLCLHYVFKSRMYWFFRFLLGSLIILSLAEVYFGLANGQSLLQVGTQKSLFASWLFPYLGIWAFYLCPQFLLTHLVLPVLSLCFLTGGFWALIKKRPGIWLHYWIMSLCCLFFVALLSQNFDPSRWDLKNWDTTVWNEKALQSIEKDKTQLLSLYPYIKPWLDQGTQILKPLF